MLPAAKYFDAIGEPVSTDYSTRAWVPADGRPVLGSSYERLIDSNVPDLRGVFLRCVNVIENNPQIPLDPNHKDPVDRPAGDFKADIIKAHRHNVSPFYAVNPFTSNLWSNGGNMCVLIANSVSPTASFDPDGNASGEETAPKNVSVYCYVRIN